MSFTTIPCIVCNCCGKRLLNPSNRNRDGWKGGGYWDFCPDCEPVMCPRCTHHDPEEDPE